LSTVYVRTAPPTTPTVTLTEETVRDQKSAATSHGHHKPRSDAEESEEESAIARRSDVEALFTSRTGLEVIRDFFSRLCGWDEEPEEDSHTTTQAPFPSSPPSNNKAVLQELGTHYAFMFRWDADALKEWQSERTRRWEMLEMLRDSPDNQHSAEVKVGSHLAALFGWDEEALVGLDEKRTKRRKLFDKLSGSYR
jgi:hypothetical protein